MDGRQILGRNIKKFRIIKGWSQSELGGKVGVKKETICRVENGRQNISLDNLLAIANALEVGLGELSMENPKSIPMRFVVSDENVRALRGLFDSMRVLLEKKPQDKKPAAD